MKRGRKKGTVYGDNNTVQRLPSYPTLALPGTEIKAMVMELRIARGEHPHHPQDARVSDERTGLKPEQMALWKWKGRFKQ